MKTPFELIAEHERFKSRYVKDAEGHEHAADGKFTGSGGGTDGGKKKPKKTKKPLSNQRLAEGTKVISKHGGTVGHIIEVNTFRSNGKDAQTYTVQTESGREVWHASNLSVDK